MEPHLKIFQEISIPYFNEHIQLTHFLTIINYKLCNFENMKLLVSEWGAYSTFININFKDFYFLFISLLLEQRIVFVSSNVKILTSIM